MAAQRQNPKGAPYDLVRRSPSQYVDKRLFFIDI